MNAGVCIFDDPNNAPEAGWASVNGSEPQRISGLSDLNMRLRWLTNLPWNKVRGLGQNSARIKHSNYLRSSLTQIQEDLGIPNRMADGDRIAKMVSEIYSRVIRMAHELYPGEEDHQAYGYGSSLAQDLRPRLLPDDVSITKEVDAAAENAFVELAVCEVENTYDDRVVVLRPPRVEHAETLLATPVPGNRWRWYDGAALGPVSARPRFLLDLAQPVLARAHIEHIEPAVGWLIGFGNTHNRGMDRHWLTHPELAWLQPFAKMEVEGAYVSSGYRRADAAYPLYCGGPVERLSYSNGLLAENYWVALASRTYDRRNRAYLHSARSAWLRAQDRHQLFCAAYELYKATNIRIRSYGVGAIYVAPRDHEVGLLKKQAAAQGLELPLSLGEDVRPLGVLA